jgi:hypothetical protein
MQAKTEKQWRERLEDGFELVKDRGKIAIYSNPKYEKLKKASLRYQTNIKAVESILV